MADFLSVGLYTCIVVFTTYISKYIFYSKSGLKRNIKKIIMAIFPALIAAFRGATGADSLMYINSYYNLQKIVESRTNGLEIGYQFVIRFFNILGLSHEAFLFFISFFTILFFEAFIENEREYIDIRFSTFLFFINLYMLSLNAMRQCLAITMGLYSFSLYRKKQYAQYTIIVLLASTFHISGLMSFSIIACDLVFRNKYYKSLTFGAIFVGVFLVFNRNILSNIMTFLTNADYASYIAADIGERGNIFSFTAKNLVPLFFLTIALVRTSKDDSRITYYVLTYGGYVLTMLSLVTGTQADRLGLNFQSLNLVTLSHVLVSKAWIHINNKKCYINHSGVKFILYGFFIVLYSFNWIYKGFGGLVPYAPFTKI